MRDFDSFGADDNARVVGMNSYHANHNGGILEPVQLPARRVVHSVPIQAWSGMKLIGSPVRACEYSRAHTMAFNGSGSQVVFVRNTVAQGYPSDGSPRDIAFSGIQFEGPGSADWWESTDPTTGKYQGRTLWMSEFHGCAWKNFRRVYWGYWDGVTVSGVSHYQGIVDTPYHLAGSENGLHAAERTFMDNNGWQKTAKPFIRSRLGKSTIGVCMPTARGWSYQIAVDWGNNLQIVGVQGDSQDSDPVDGCGIRINGGDGIHITQCSFKGQCDDLAAAFEHAVIEVVGGSHIVVQGNNFLRDGTRAPASTPLVYTGPNVRANAVKFGLNGFPGFDGVVRQAKAGQIVCIDPTVKVITG